MARVFGGRTNYGEAIGIIMLETAFPRLPGDVGNASTFSFPVRYKVVKGASPQKVVKEADPALLQPFIEAARELEKEGVRAITTSCGFLAMFQREMADAVNVPVFSSSLLQVPLAYAVISKSQQVGILTARVQSLTERHFAGAGISGIPVVVAGMDDAPEFTGAFIDGKPDLDVEKCRQEMIEAAKGLKTKHPRVGAIVMECTNMPPFAKAVQEAVNLPVFDAVTLINYVYSVVVRHDYQGFM
ncbi:MAG: aspartate/glutamate racemase family protein [Peptococcaceae bacterium]|jgi:aspartate/glutamate racemase|nr:aspartate/glutamate racemase family protein [Peptococcaceae bacterium]MDH7525422.1 aspartate/glutamate racemase family protein [Peptococcaceae bacterium]